MNNDTTHDRAVIREVVENWVLWRDSGNWDAFATVWHADGVMVATWQQSSAKDFIAACRAAWDNGLEVLHLLGGSAVEVSGNRAIAQTRMTIKQRATVHDQLVDVTCTGRFYDFFERREGRWAIVTRQPVYEHDRIDAVDPAASLVLDDELLTRFPAGYRHLAYLQTHLGMAVRTDMPGTRGPAVERLYANGRVWLEGGPPPPRAAADRST